MKMLIFPNELSSISYLEDNLRELISITFMADKEKDKIKIKDIYNCFEIIKESITHH